MDGALELLFSIAFDKSFNSLERLLLPLLFDPFLSISRISLANCFISSISFEVKSLKSSKSFFVSLLNKFNSDLVSANAVLAKSCNEKFLKSFISVFNSPI